MPDDLQHEEITQAALPQVINEQTGAIDLYRIAVIALAVIGGLGLAGCLVLAALDKTVPDSAIVLASVAVGALAGMVGGQAAANA